MIIVTLSTVRLLFLALANGENWIYIICIYIVELEKRADLIESYT